MTTMPNKSPEPMPDGAGACPVLRGSAVASVKPRGPRPFTGFTPRVGGGSAFFVRHEETI